MVVWKTVLPSAEGRQIILMPGGSTVLMVKAHEGQIALWFACDPNQSPTARTFGVSLTGSQLVDDTWTYRGTAFYPDGMGVYHVFEQP